MKIQNIIHIHFLKQNHYGLIQIEIPSSTLPEQEGTLYFQVIHRRTVRMIHTGFHIRQDEWNDTTSSIRIAGTPERQNFLRLTAYQNK